MNDEVFLIPHFDIQCSFLIKNRDKSFVVHDSFGLDLIAITMHPIIAASKSMLTTSNGNTYPCSVVLNI